MVVDWFCNPGVAVRFCQGAPKLSRGVRVDEGLISRIRSFEYFPRNQTYPCCSIMGVHPGAQEVEVRFLSARAFFIFRETRARCMGLTVNQWLGGFDSHTRSQIADDVSALLYK